MHVRRSILIVMFLFLAHRVKIAHYQGYITINWTKMKKETKRVQNRIAKRSGDSSVVLQEVNIVSCLYK